MTSSYGIRALSPRSRACRTQGDAQGIQSAQDAAIGLGVGVVSVSHGGPVRAGEFGSGPPTIRPRHGRGLRPRPSRSVQG